MKIWSTTRLKIKINFSSRFTVVPNNEAYKKEMVQEPKIKGSFNNSWLLLKRNED